MCTAAVRAASQFFRIFLRAKNRAAAALRWVTYRKRLKVRVFLMARWTVRVKVPHEMLAYALVAVGAFFM